MIGDNVPKILAAREDFDVRTAEVKNLTLDSTKNQLKEYLSGSGTITLAKTGFNTAKQIVEVYHNLNYQPLFHGWFKRTGTTTWSKIPSSIYITIGGVSTGFGSGISRPTDNLLQLCFFTADPWVDDYDEDFDYKYIIYIDPYKDAWT